MFFASYGLFNRLYFIAIMKKFAFIDVNTQKCFVEHFGSKAIEDCPNIRENLMHLTELGIKSATPIISPVYIAADSEEGSNDAAKTLDTETEDYVWEYEPGHSQYLVRHDDMATAGINEVLNICEAMEIDTVFIYGVPLESSVKGLALGLIGNIDKVWVVKDCVKGYTDEQVVLDELKEAGVKLLTTRSLDKFVNL
jgi:nicotinamidase-related amidase